MPRLRRAIYRRQKYEIPTSRPHRHRADFFGAYHFAVLWRIKVVGASGYQLCRVGFAHLLGQQKGIFRALRRRSGFKQWWLISKYN